MSTSGTSRAVRKLRADFFADVEHGSFVALAFADHDGAAHGNGVHGLAHGLGGNLVGEFALALAHGAGGGDGRSFHHAQESGSQIAFDILTETPDFAFGFGMSSHEASKMTGQRL